MLSGKSLFLIVIPVAVIIVSIWYLAVHRENHWSCRIALLLIISGGTGNLIDRIAFGQVTDMFSFSIFPPVFNLADVSVTLGCVLLVFYVLFDETLKKKRS